MKIDKTGKLRVKVQLSKLDNTRKYLIWCNQRGIAYVISRAYQWFNDKYLPAIQRLENAGLKKDRALLSDCYYMIGDIHDFNECPKAAIKAYKKSFELYSINSAALREMGCMYERIGCYKKAASLLKKSFRICPGDELSIQDDENRLKAQGVPLYRKKDVCWKAREYLAQDQADYALRVLKKKHSVPARQIKACAYSLLNHKASFLDQWQKIADGKDKIEVTYADWFYLTDSIWNDTAFWEILAVCAKRDRFQYSVWPISAGLDAVIPFPLKRKRNSKSDLRQCNKRVFLLAQYHIARINRDPKLISKLYCQYPTWSEVEKLFRRILS